MLSIEGKSVLEDVILVIEEGNASIWVILRWVGCVIGSCDIRTSPVEP